MTRSISVSIQFQFLDYSERALKTNCHAVKEARLWGQWRLTLTVEWTFRKKGFLQVLSRCCQRGRQTVPDKWRCCGKRPPVKVSSGSGHVWRRWRRRTQGVKNDRRILKQSVFNVCGWNHLLTKITARSNPLLGMKGCQNCKRVIAAAFAICVGKLCHETFKNLSNVSRLWW